MNRDRIEAVVVTPAGIYKLNNWARNRGDPAPAVTPSLKRPDGTLELEPSAKAELHVESSFLHLRTPTCQTFEDYQYPRQLECPPITAPQIMKAIMKAAANKAAGPEGIPNRILHLICDRIKHILVAIFNTYLHRGICSEEFKDSMPVVVRKPDKRDYTQVRTYRPIALFNTVSKSF